MYIMLNVILEMYVLFAKQKNKCLDCVNTKMINDFKFYFTFIIFNDVIFLIIWIMELNFVLNFNFILWLIYL